MSTENKITGIFLGMLTLLSGCSAREEAPARPNILICIADDQSFPHAGAYGTDWVSTPAFDRVAREGLLFMNAYTPNAKCAPSRACILTGRNSWQLEEAANHSPHFPGKFKTYAEALGQAGYHTGFTGKGWAPGDPGEIDGRTRELCGPRFSERTSEPPTSGINKIDYAGNFRDFLDRRADGQPFCFWYGATEPHRGYEYGSGIAKGGKDKAQIDQVPGFWPDTDTVRTDLLDYAYEVEHFDRHLGRMLAELEARGELENTLVIVTADNGMPFPAVKGQEYEYSNHLPLAVMWGKGIKNPGRVIEDYVSFIDFAPTFMELSRVDPEEAGMQPFTGRSLTDIFFSEKSGQVNPERDFMLIGKERHDVGRPHDQGYPIRGIIREGYLYLRNFKPDRWPAGNPETGYLNTDGSPTKSLILNRRRYEQDDKWWKIAFGKRPEEELYAIDEDPWCLNNLAGQPEHQELKTALNDRMVKALKEQEDPRMFGKGDLFDNYPYASPATQNFYERYMRGDSVHAGWVNPSDFEPEAFMPEE